MSNFREILLEREKSILSPYAFPTSKMTSTPRKPAKSSSFRTFGAFEEESSYEIT